VNTELLGFMRERPAVYSMTGEPFWDDPYISSQMLIAHLNPDWDAASRNHKFIRDSAAWIASLAAPVTGKALLDLGCGPGLYAEAFDAQGFRVTGVDYSRRSIRYAEDSARKKSLSIDYRWADYLSLDETARYDIADIIYCDFGVLSPETRRDLLRRVKRALKPGGLFIVDAFTPRQYDDFIENAVTEYSEGGFWSPESCVYIRKTLRYDEEQAYLEQYLVVTERETRRYNLWNHAFEETTFRQELYAAGFHKVTFYGDAAGAPYTPESKTICAVAE
jgi:2-polyprenyl-3-methyl-5-hydroxy-6-metoxy-1,4-benzoquinol methylase